MISQAARAGARRALPLTLGLFPFGLVTGVVSQGAGLDLAQSVGMSALVYAGSSQLVALGAWSHPAPIFGATLAALVVNVRFALMGPVLAPWLDTLRGWRLFAALALLVDHPWAISITEMRAGRHDAGFYLGAAAVVYVAWIACTALGFAAGAALRPVPGHPLFFASTAAFLVLLVPLWRGAADLWPWAIAAAAAYALHRALPGEPWHIAGGALAGALCGAVIERTRR